MHASVTPVVTLACGRRTPSEEELRRSFLRRVSQAIVRDSFPDGKLEEDLMLLAFSFLRAGIEVVK